MYKQAYDAHGNVFSLFMLLMLVLLLLLVLQLWQLWQLLTMPNPNNIPESRPYILSQYLLKF